MGGRSGSGVTASCSSFIATAGLKLTVVSEVSARHSMGAISSFSSLLMRVTDRLSNDLLTIVLCKVVASGIVSTPSVL